MLNYPFKYTDACYTHHYRNYPVIINKNLYEFIAIDTIKSNQNSSPNIDGFNYYSKKLFKIGDISFCADSGTIVKTKRKNLEGILESLRSLMKCEPVLYMGALRLAFKSNNKDDYHRVRAAKLLEQINFNFDPLLDSHAFNEENNTVVATMYQIDAAISKCPNFENIINNFKTKLIPFSSTFF